MKITASEIPDVKIIEPRVFGDRRGYFFESYRHDDFARAVGPMQFVQENESFSVHGVLRGLHFQKPPVAQGKLVRVVRGEVLDVAVDIRCGSPWFGKHVARKLNEENKWQMWVPAGFAHGYVVLSDEAIFAYMCDNYYSPEHEAGIRYDDPFLKIDWILDKAKIQVSEKDSQHPCFEEIISAEYFQFA
ncbi:MAG: dTDP-4-dehydrorhamnose 3,5-epimerase [Candidatus Aminicenantes bacterium]|nr:dTDP-4-dehydrorhamnose 3,5-epimerase [Candidatus Aminicenantes bacterium]